LQEGPDGRLYVANAIGEIRRYDLDATTGLPSGPPLVVDTYLNVSFPTATTSLAPGDTATIYSTLTFVDNGAMIQTNDYSFDAAATIDQPYDRIPVYSGDSLIYGTPPGQ